MKTIDSPGGSGAALRAAITDELGASQGAAAFGARLHRSGRERRDPACNHGDARAYRRIARSRD